MRSGSIHLDFTAGTLNEEELIALCELASQVPLCAGPIVEIGTLFGQSTIELALAAPYSQIITVDKYRWNPWGLDQESHYQLSRRMLWFGIKSGRIEQVRLDKRSFYSDYVNFSSATPSLVFIDADHSYRSVKEDLTWAMSFPVRPIICGHDYCDQHPGVIQAVDEIGGPTALHGSLFVL